MTSPWVVTTSTERVDLDTSRQGELTFTVTNSGDAADQVVFEPVPGEGVERTALTVDNPARQVPGHGSASFLVKIAIPQQATAGRYEMYGQAYSAHLAPEETLGRSGRVVFEVTPAPQPKKRPWWLLAVAALVVIVLAVVLWLVFSRKPTPPPKPSPSVLSTAVAAPNLVGLAEPAATDALAKAGLKLGTLRHRFDQANAGKVVMQAVPAGTVVPRGAPVDLVVGIAPALPTPGNPPNGANFGNIGVVPFQWAPVPNANGYRLVVTRQSCATILFGQRNCGTDQLTDQRVPAPTTTVNLPFPPAPLPAQLPGSVVETVTWQVFALDDFGDQSPPSTSQFTIRF